MNTIKKVVEYDRAQGEAFVDAIKTEKPIAVHAHQVSSEHDEVYSFSFFDKHNKIHDYMHEIDDYGSPIIGKEQMKHFAQLYGAPLVGGSVEYHGQERYHFFDGGVNIREYNGFSQVITYKAWQETLEHHLDGKKKKVLVRNLSGSFNVVVDAIQAKNHFVLIFRPSKRQNLTDIIHDNFRGDTIIDVTPYAAWLKTIMR